MNLLQTLILSNKNGIELKISNFGATILGLKVPDRNNNLIDIVIGLKNANDYIQKPYSDVLLFLGSSIGRYAGRISKGKFNVNGQEYSIKNKDGVHLHSQNGFDKQYWNIVYHSKSKATFSYMSPDLENGYPGNLDVQATFELYENNAIKIGYYAKTDRSTPVNLTSHVYFNLNGKSSILNHDLLINSNKYLEVDKQLIPTGKILESKNTILDRTNKSKINKYNFDGYDDTFIMNQEKIQANLSSSETGINLCIYSNQPAIVVYTPKKFPDLPFKEKTNNCDFPAICFEPQNFPDAPNNSHFPNSILEPKTNYVNEILLEFSII